MTIETPMCDGLVEIEGASDHRARLNALLSASLPLPSPLSPLEQHLIHGLALTTGSALGASPPSIEQCLEAFTLQNSARLSAGARAWSKHGHRSGSHPATAKMTKEFRASTDAGGWWGRAKGPVDVINANALELFWKVMNGATWRNLHWLPHEVLVYEVRVQEGYGMRWFRVADGPWEMRGFVEPMMENGHEYGWRHWCE